MTSDEKPREPHESDSASAPGTSGDDGAWGTVGPGGTTGSPGSAGSEGSAGPTGSAAPSGSTGSEGSQSSPSQQWAAPPGSPDGGLAEAGAGEQGATAEQPPQTWSSPPNGGGEHRGQQGRLPVSTWLVTLIGATVYAVSVTLVVNLTVPILVLAHMDDSVALSIGTPLVAAGLVAFLFWAFRRMLVAARFPRPTAAMALFTVVVAVAIVGSIALPRALGFGQADERIMGAGVVAALLAALAMLLPRRARTRWGSAAAAVVLVVSGAASWQRGDGMVESMREEQREINLAYEDEAAVLDVEGWNPFRSEINDAEHDPRGDAVLPGGGGPGRLSVFTVFYQDGDGGYVRTATWADERTAQNPDAVLRAWCHDEGVHCEEIGVEGADGPVVAEWDLEDVADAEDLENIQDAEGTEQVGAPESVRYEYEPGRVVYLGPWIGEPDRTREERTEAPGTSETPNGVEDATGTDGEAVTAPLLGHDDFEAKELAELVTQVRPAEDEDLADLADRTAEYFRSPEDVLTEY